MFTRPWLPLLGGILYGFTAGLLFAEGGARDLATFLVGTGAALAWWFVLLYRRHDWRRYQEGRHVMQFTLMVAIILSLATETRIFGPYPGIQYVACVMYTWIVWLLASRIHLMLQANREHA